MVMAADLVLVLVKVWVSPTHDHNH
jgi:hypothetical protein